MGEMRAAFAHSGTKKESPNDFVTLFGHVQAEF